MGSYIYKVTKNRVMLADHREANVAIYAYKPCGMSEVDWHRRSGAERADAAAKAGEFSGLIVMGRKDPESKKIEVDIASPVFVSNRGSFSDDWMSDNGERLEGPGAVPAWAKSPCWLIRRRVVPRGEVIKNGLRWDCDELIKERKVIGRGKVPPIYWEYLIASEVLSRPRAIEA